IINSFLKFNKRNRSATARHFPHSNELQPTLDLPVELLWSFVWPSDILSHT
ncbi:hypothetical protein L9F63_028108, partial [Diploptera punctata]